MKAFLTSLFALALLQASAQITTGKPTIDIEKPDSVILKTPSSTSLYLGAGSNNSFRKLVPNDEPYGKPLGYRENETNIKIWSFELGLRNQINSYLQFDGGLSLERFGETYTSTPQAQTGDSTYSYINHYSYISIPLQLYGTIGTDFKLYGGAGLQPGIVGGFNREITITDSIGNAKTEEINQPDQLSGFILNARFSAGLQWKWSKYAGVYVNYTYQLGLTSTLEKQDPYKHYPRTGGIRFGLYFVIPE